MIIMEKVIEYFVRVVEFFIESFCFDYVMNEFNGEVKWN